MLPIVLIGCAPCWHDDLQNLKKIISEFDVMAIGLDCPYADTIAYFATYHFIDIPNYIKRRKEVGCNIDFEVICHRQELGVDIVEPFKPPRGSSALLGTTAAIKLGYKKIILCGCPLEGKNRNGFQSYNEFQKGWLARYSEVSPYVRSMSGWTREYLGNLTKEWLDK